MELTVRLRLSYDGTAFHGWQIQPGLPTLQAALSAAVCAVTGDRVVVHASGRTDAGVHALGQAVHFVVNTRLPLPRLLAALNARLPGSIRVWEATAMPPGFHARHDALAKWYRYRIYREPVCPPFLRDYVYHHPFPLNEAAMATAADEFVGEHDFRSFAATPVRRLPAPMPSDSVRTIFRSRLRRDGPELVYDVTGRGFLHHMVRNLIGYLLGVGRGSQTVGAVPAVLAARQRAAADRTAPACGLYLVAVAYAPDELGFPGMLGT